MESRNNWLLCVAVVASLVLVLGACAPAAAPGADYPTKPIEFTTHSSAGGSGYVLGEVMRDAIEKDKLLPQPLVVVSKTGSGAAIQFSYMLEKKGDPHVVGTYSGQILTTPMLEKLPWTYKNFTPIAFLVGDPNILVVNSKSPYKTMQDLLDDAKKRPNELINAISSVGSSDALVPRMIAKQKGVEWKVMPAGGGPEGMTAVLGGHATFTMNNPGTLIDHIKAGNLRPLMAGTRERYPALPDVPTQKELGFGEPIMTPRGLIGPPEMPEYARAKLEAVTKKVVETETFKKYIADSMQVVMWMDGAASFKYLEEQNELFKVALTDAGLLK